MGKYLIKDLSTKEVKLISSTIAWAFACLTIAELIKSVKRCLSLVVILHILQLVVVLVNDSSRVRTKVSFAVSTLHQSKTPDFPEEVEVCLG